MYALMDERGQMRADGEPYADVATVAQRIAEGSEDFDEAKIAAMNLVPDQYRGLDRGVGGDGGGKSPKNRGAVQELGGFDTSRV